MILPLQSVQDKVRDSREKLPKIQRKISTIIKIIYDQTQHK